MSFATTVAEDYKVAAHDAGETVTFHAIRASTTQYVVTYADSHELTTREVAASGGFYSMGDQKWSLGREQITVAADYPKPGDKIVDASSVSWHILDVVLDDLGIAFECVSRKAR